jgi:Rad3-related DNA helicase
MARYNENVSPSFLEAPTSFKNNEKVEFYQEQLIVISQFVPDIVDQILADIDEKNDQLERFVSLRSDDDRVAFIREAIGEVEYTKILDGQRKDAKIRKVGLTGADFQLWKDQTENQIADLGKDKQALESLETKIKVFLESYKENPLWVVLETRFDKKPKSPIKALSFQPIFAKEFAQDYFFNLADIHIIMSATILDHEKLAEDLGIAPDEYYFIKEEPTIPPDRNRIYNLGIADFAKQEGIPPECEEEFWKLVTKRIDLILTKHKNQKGIIHGNTHDICKKIKKYSTHKKRILVVDTEDKDSLNDRQKLIDTHFDKKNRNTVICSPSLTEGIDLKQELSEFQILVKVPYPDLGNEWVKERKRRDTKFYKDRTARVICQAIGRSVRSENDYCITYTLDIRFESQYVDWRPKVNTELFTRHVMPVSYLRTFWSMEELGKLLPRITMLPDGEIEVADWFF